MDEQLSTRQESQRARRFVIQLPMRYRIDGETVWHEGRTANISHSGVLFWADKLLEAQTAIEIVIMMPDEIDGEMGAEIVCRGEIVRTGRSTSTQAQPCLAARILEYRFARGQRTRAA